MEASERWDSYMTKVVPLGDINKVDSFTYHVGFDETVNCDV